MAVGGATCTRSTPGSGNLGGRPRIVGLSVSETAETEARRGPQGRGSSESRDPPSPRGSQARRWMKRMAWVPLKWYPRITQSKIIILTYPGLCKSGYLIPTVIQLSYPGICKSRHLIPTCPVQYQSTKSILGYPLISWLAQGVVFSDIG